MRKIIVKSSQYELINSYLDAVMIDNALISANVDYFIKEKANNMCYTLNTMLRHSLSETQYDTFKDAECDADEHEDLGTVDMEILSKYIEIEVR